MVRIIGISGASCSGKSTLCRNINTSLSIPTITLDDFFKNIENYVINTDGSINFDHPDNIHWEELIGCIRSLKNNETVQIPIYQKGPDGGRKGYRELQPANNILLEGYMLFLNPNLLEIIPKEDRVFLDLPREKQQERRTQVYSSIESPEYFEEAYKVFEELILPSRNEAGHILDASFSQERLVELFIQKFNLAK